jgi:hypothetical protein
MAVAGDAGVIALFADGTLARYDADGGERWRVATRAAAPAVLQCDAANVVLLAATRAVALSPAGEERASVALAGNTPPGLDAAGRLYSCDRDWILSAYRLPIASIAHVPAPLVSASAAYLAGETAAREWLAALGTGAALATIARSVRDGTVGEREGEYVAALRLVIGGADRASLRNEREAARLLGLLGSAETLPFIYDALKRAAQPSLASALVEALGRIGADPDGATMRALTTLGMERRATTPDTQLLVAIARAAGNVARFVGPPAAMGAARLLSHLALSPEHAVERAARQELRTLWGTGRVIFRPATRQR